MMQDTAPEARELYADIFDLPHWRSSVHPHMSAWERAAQFSSYKALAGYEDMVDEEARQVGTQDTLSETEIEILNQKLNRIITLTEAGEHPTVTFTVYEADKRKAGGRYVEITDSVKRVDIVNRVIELTSMEGVMSTIFADSRLSDTNGVRRAAAWSVGGMSFICVKPFTTEAR